MSQSLASYVIMHGAFARPSGAELMEIAALQAGARVGEAYHSLVRCDVPDRAPEPAADGTIGGVSDEENQQAPTADEVFAHLHAKFALGRNTVVMWGGMAYRFHVYARSKQLNDLFLQTRVIDLQAAVVSYLDVKTSSCKNPRSVAQLLNVGTPGDYRAQGSLPAVRAINAILAKLVADGWTPEATPAAITNGCDIGQVAEEMRIERWEQVRERQTNLGIARRPFPDGAPAFIVLDCEHVSLRTERFSRLIELALVVAYRKERPGHAGYELGGKPFSSLIHVQHVDQAWSKSWEMTGIDPEDVRRAPPLPRVIAGMIAAAPWDRGVLVTWGPDDAPVITQNCIKAGIPSPITELPLINLQRAFSQFYDLGSQQVGLTNAASYLSIDTSEMDMHRALADTMVTWRVMERMLKDGWTPHWRTWHRYTASAPAAN